MNTAPLISFGLLCDDGCTITLDKQEISVENNGQEIIKGTRNKKNGMWEVPLETQQPAAAINDILVQTSKTELARYLHTSIFRQTTEILTKDIKQGFLKTWPGLTKKIIKRHLEKLGYRTMGHLQMGIQGLKSTKEKSPDTDLEEKSKKNVVFCTTVEPNTTKEGGYSQIYADGSSPLQVWETNTFTSCMCMVVTPS